MNDIKKQIIKMEDTIEKIEWVIQEYQEMLVRAVDDCDGFACSSIGCERYYECIDGSDSAKLSTEAYKNLKRARKILNHMKEKAGLHDTK